jgi:hypothetical protein
MNPQDAAQGATVILSGSSSAWSLRWQERLQALPLLVGDFVTSHALSLSHSKFGTAAASVQWQSFCGWVVKRSDQADIMRGRVANTPQNAFIAEREQMVWVEQVACGGLRHGASSEAVRVR